MPKVAFDMPVEQYVELLSTMNKREIAQQLNISEGTLYAWINKNQDQINKFLNNIQPTTAEKKPSETKTTQSKKESDSAEYERLIKVLQEQIEQDTELITRLQTKVAELENLHAACDDVENEVASLREEKKELQEYYDRTYMENIEKDRQVENWKYRYKLLMQDHEQLDKQNKTMRELIKQWA